MKALLLTFTLALATGLLLGHRANVANTPRSGSSFETAEDNAHRRQFKALLSQKTAEETLFWLRAHWGTLTPADYAAAAADLLAAGDGRHEQLFREVMESWGELSPREAVAFAESMTGPRSHAAWSAAMAGWAARDPDALLAWLRNQSFLSGPQRDTILSALTRSRPNEVFELLEKTPPQNRDTTWNLYDAFFAELAGADPSRATALLQRVPEAAQGGALTAIISHWNDADAALAWLEGLPEGPLRATGFHALTALLAPISPREAAELAARELPGSYDASHAFVKPWLALDPEEAERFFIALPDSTLRQTALATIENEKAFLRPYETLDKFLHERTFSEKTFIQVVLASRALSATDPDAFREWVIENHKELSTEKLTRILYQSALSDPAAAAKFLTSIPEGGPANQAYSFVAIEWTKREPDEARRFLQTLTSEEARNSFLRGITMGTAMTDIKAAFDEIANIGNPGLESEILQGIIPYLNDPSQFAAWLKAHPDVIDAPALHGGLVDSWTLSDPQAAASWVKGLPEGEAREMSIKRYAFFLVQQAPEQALQWTTLLRDEKQRAETQVHLLELWGHFDEAGAKAWAKKLPEGQIDQP